MKRTMRKPMKQLGYYHERLPIHWRWVSQRYRSSRRSESERKADRRVSDYQSSMDYRVSLQREFVRAA